MQSTACQEPLTFLSKAIAVDSHGSFSCQACNSGTTRGWHWIDIDSWLSLSDVFSTKVVETTATNSGVLTM